MDKQSVNYTPCKKAVVNNTLFLHTCAGDCFSLLAAKLNELPMFSRKFWNSFGGSIFGISEFEGLGFLGGGAGGEVGRGSTTSDFEDADFNGG